MIEGPVIRAEDAYAIDAKMDDGFPNTGGVVSFSSNATPNCTDDVNYTVSDTTNGCLLIFITGF